jgi:hypothetical protein
MSVPLLKGKHAVANHGDVGTSSTTKRRPTTTSTSSASKRRTLNWLHFETVTNDGSRKLKLDPTSKLVRCLPCPCRYVKFPDSNTSKMWTHLHSCHRDEFARIKIIQELIEQEVKSKRPGSSAPNKLERFSLTGLGRNNAFPG